MELIVDQEKLIAELKADMECLHDQYGTPNLKPGEFTLVMYADMLGLNRGAAERELADAVASGNFIEINEERRVDGKRVKHVYKKAIK